MADVRSLPSVRGFRHTIAPPQRIYAVGDIHGCAHLLDAMLRRVELDLDRRPVGSALEIYLGDYLDRGPDSFGVVERLVRRQAQGRALCLAGNHERAALAALGSPSAFLSWLRWGAAETLVSYGIRPPDRRPADLTRAFLEFGERFPALHQQFLEALPLFYLHGRYAFVHAGLRPGVAIEDQSAEDLTTIRRPFLDYRGSHPHLVVHGHTPVREPEFPGNRINLDTGAFATGRLSCLVIEGDDMRLL